MNLPIALPELSGAHTGDRIGKTILEIFKSFKISPSKIGYFVLDNAANNDRALQTIAEACTFDATVRRLRCGPHILNLVGQTIIFGVDRDSFGNEEAQLYTEEYFLREWRRYGPLGVLINVLHFIKTPKQYSILRNFQLKEASQLKLPKPYNLLEPIKLVITRWNSYYDAFERASKLMQPLDAYIQYHINETRTADIYA